jgi:quinol monooxygenase YgiN
MVIVRITMTARPEKRKEVMQTLLSMIEPTLQKKGCLSYQVFQDIDDENVFSLIKEWETREDLEHHIYRNLLKVFEVLKQEKENDLFSM